MALLSELTRELTTDPIDVGLRLWAKFREVPERRKPPWDYIVERDWESRIHQCTAAPFPCAKWSELAPIWNDVLLQLTSRGITPGPASYFGHNDGDPAFIRAIWCLTRHLPAVKVVETGVAHGVTSRFVLEALRRNGAGQLWSIDLPPQTFSDIHDEIGTAVDPQLHDRWMYIRGSSRRRLSRLLQKTGMIDLFIHDSLHTEYNTLFELQTVWPFMRPGGAIVVDDIDTSWAFHRFAEALPEQQAMVCEAEPLRPDPLRESRNRKGLFGIILKT